MNQIPKAALLLLIGVIVIAGTLTATTTFASTTNPSAPQFRVNYVDHSYDVPTTYTIDPYNGQTINHTGYRVLNKTVEISITNQPFMPTTKNGNTTSLYYSIRVKGHFEEWNSANTPEGYRPDTLIKASDSQYTVIIPPVSSGVRVGDQIDVEVKAVIGFYFPYYGQHREHIMPIGNLFEALGDSGWSNTQTLTISDESSASPTEAPYIANVTESPPQQTPAQSGVETSFLANLGWEVTAVIAVLGVVVAVLAVGMFILWRRGKR